MLVKVYILYSKTTGRPFKGLEWMLKDFAMTWHWVIRFIFFIYGIGSAESHPCKVSNTPSSVRSLGSFSASFLLTKYKVLDKKKCMSCFYWLFCDPVCGLNTFILKHSFYRKKKHNLASHTVLHVLHMGSLTCARCLRYPARRTNLAQLKRSLYFTAAVRQHVDHVHRK